MGKNSKSKCYVEERRIVYKENRRRSLWPVYRGRGTDEKVLKAEARPLIEYLENSTIIFCDM